MNRRFSAFHFQPASLRPVALWGAALLAALGLFFLARAVTVCWRLTPIPGLPPASCRGAETQSLVPPRLEGDRELPDPTAVPDAPAPQQVEYPAWDGASRINILFVGLRGGYPQEQACPFCTDTLILLTVDPATSTAGMLSIPRDMWVNIPGFGYSRINTAWTLGRRSRLPGGGPNLTMKTVSHFIGVPVHYYVQVDFDTFVDLIDLVGGVDVYNDETLVLDPASHGRDYPKVKLTCCGMRHMNGRVALAYARCRHIEQGCSDGDIGRARRQQKVIFGIRERVLDPQNFPELLARAPELYSTFSAGIRTNLPLDDAVRLAVMARAIPQENIRHGVIDTSMVGFGNVILGGQNASVMKPLPDKIRILRDEIFTSAGPASPLAQGHPLTLMQADGARIRLLNATSEPDLAARTRDFLLRRGLWVTEMGETKPQSRTVIVLYSPKLYALKFVLGLFEVERSTQLLIRPDASQAVDIEIQIGKDWAERLPIEEDRPQHPSEDLP